MLKKQGVESEDPIGGATTTLDHMHKDAMSQDEGGISKDEDLMSQDEDTLSQDENAMSQDT